MFEHREAAAELKRRARISVAERYSLSGAALAFEALYRELSDEEPSASEARHRWRAVERGTGEGN